MNDYRKAIQLALAMEQPGRLLSLFKNIKTIDADDTSITGHPSVDEVIHTLGGSELAKLLLYVRDWNTNAKTSRVAQGILHAVVKLKSSEEVMQAFHDRFGDDEEKGPATSGSTLKDLVDALIPYTERHLARMDRLVQESYMVDYILGEMDDGMFDISDDAIDVDTGAVVIT